MSLSPSPTNVLVEKVKLKLNFLDYDDYKTIPDVIVEQHLQTAKTLIDSVFDTDQIQDDQTLALYEECITEFAKYLVMLSWIANAIDTERTPSAWNTILKNEKELLKSLLLQLIPDITTVSQLIGEEVNFNISTAIVKSSYNLIARFWVVGKPPFYIPK